MAPDELLHLEPSGGSPVHCELRSRTVFFVIPAYNEEANIASLLEQTRAKMDGLSQSYQVLIVDDGSCDGTAAIASSYAASMPVRVISHARNRGVGHVFRTGFRAALAHAAADDIIVTKEADNTSDLSVLPTMLARIHAGDELVLASCYAKGGGVVGTTPLRLMLSLTANALLKAFFPIRGVHTYSSFYRAYTSELLARAQRAYQDRLLTEDGFVCMVELLVKLAVLRARISEVPMRLRGDRRGGKSKMKVLYTMRDYLRFGLRNWRLWGKTR